MTCFYGGCGERKGYEGTCVPTGLTEEGPSLVVA